MRDTVRNGRTCRGTMRNGTVNERGQRERERRRGIVRDAGEWIDMGDIVRNGGIS